MFLQFIQEYINTLNFNQVKTIHLLIYLLPIITLCIIIKVMTDKIRIKEKQNEITNRSRIIIFFTTSFLIISTIATISISEYILKEEFYNKVSTIKEFPDIEAQLVLTNNEYKDIVNFNPNKIIYSIKLKNQICSKVEMKDKETPVDNNKILIKKDPEPVTQTYTCSKEIAQVICKGNNTKECIGLISSNLSSLINPNIKETQPSSN